MTAVTPATSQSWAVVSGWTGQDEKYSMTLQRLRAGSPRSTKVEGVGWQPAPHEIRRNLEDAGSLDIVEVLKIGA